MIFESLTRASGWSLDQQKKSPWREHRVPRRQERNRNFATDTAATTLLSLRATKFEFEKRFWIICAIYFVGFFLSAFDRTPFIVALRHSIAPSIARGSVDADTFARVAITIGALLVFLSAALRTWGAAYLRTEIVHDTAQHSDALVADGPFRYTRNPLYLANLPMAAGIGVLATRSGLLRPRSASMYRNLRSVSKSISWQRSCRLRTATARRETSSCSIDCRATRSAAPEEVRPKGNLGTRKGTEGTRGLRFKMSS